MVLLLTQQKNGAEALESKSTSKPGTYDFGADGCADAYYEWV